MGVSMNFTLILRIAVVGILISLLNQVLKQSGRDDIATLTTLTGLLVVLFWIFPYISDLVLTIERLFQLVS